MAIKIAAANIKGGIGKTTTILALADGLIKRGYRVLMIDTDPQRNTSRVYKAQTEDTETLYDIITSGYLAEKCIQSTEYGDIIAGDSLLKSADTDVKTGPKMYKYISKALKNIEDKYDFILLDTPPRSGVLLGNVLFASDYVVVPVTCDIFGVQGITDFAQEVEEYMEDNENLKILGLLKIKYKGRQALTRDIEENLLPDFAKQLSTKIFESTIRESVKCQEAQTLQMRLSDYAPSCTTYADYEAFVDELLREVL